MKSKLNSSVLVLWLATAAIGAEMSHPPLRTAVPPVNHPRGAGPAYFVDASRGEDRAAGTEQAPWQTASYALTRLKPGDTLFLRGGVYRENLRVSIAGTKEAPITIRSYPGEQATIDGGFAEFFDTPQTAWTPYNEGGKNEFRSTRAYQNLRHVVGSFGDSMIGLNTYYHAQDLRAENEFLSNGDGKKSGEDVQPVYCGPGLWHDPATGHLHIRLAHTHLPGMPNYRGPTDPRQVPLVLAEFRSIPLFLDGARHVHVQDMVIRGGGHDAVLLDTAADVRLEGLTIWAAGYGLKGISTQRLTLDRSAIYGNVPPWTFRTDTSKREYPGRSFRDITRLNTHALLVTDAGKEFDVYFYPRNDDWEISHCDFADGHDGVYLGGLSMRFHHNRVHHTQDDGIYLSPMYPRFTTGRAQIHVYQNYIGACLTALAFGGPEPVNTDEVYIYRNLIELRSPVATGRPLATQKDQVRFSLGKAMGDHGSPPWSAMKIYHNTIVAEEKARTADMALVGAAHEERPRYLFNNILLHLGGLPALSVIDASKGQQDGNLYWGPMQGKTSAGNFFERYRASPAFKQSKEAYADGFESHAMVIDPLFASLATQAGTTSDYSLSSGSPAIDAGVKLPSDWPDPLRGKDTAAPDLGFLPAGMKMFSVGP